MQGMADFIPKLRGIGAVFHRDLVNDPCHSLDGTDRPGGFIVLVMPVDFAGQRHKPWPSQHPWGSKHPSGAD